MTLKIKKAGEGHRHPAIEAVNNAVTREETARLNANVPKSFYREVRLFAARHDTTVTNVIMDALRAHISKNSNE